MMSQQRRSRKSIAPESIKTKRAREKLKKHWEEQDRLITPQALEDTIDKIHKWIAVHAPNRVPLKEKGLRLFDQNQNAVNCSKKVQEIALRLKTGQLVT